MKQYKSKLLYEKLINYPATTKAHWIKYMAVIPGGMQKQC